MAGVLSACGVPAEPEALGTDVAAIGSAEAPRNMGGAYTCEIEVPSTLDLRAAPLLIERDRMYISARPGLVKNHIQISAAPGHLYTGLVTRFDTYGHAVEFNRWLEEEYDLDGTLYYARPFFLNNDCHVWEVLGQADPVADEASRVMSRTERFAVSDPDARRSLSERFPAIEAEARSRGYTSVWLLYSESEHLAALVYFENPPPSQRDYSSAPSIAMRPALASGSTFDRSSWVLSTWFPFQAGDRGAPSLWPNSPPFPAPYAGDGLCTPSRGETSSNTTDCLSTCGNGVQDQGENSWNCSADVNY